MLRGRGGGALSFARVAAIVVAASACEPTPAPAQSSHATPIHFEHAPATGDLVATVRNALAPAHARHGTLLVYVGATWCEPCQYFHRAVEAHELDREFPNLTLLEFDLDRDAARLQAAGYASRMIPLFAVPSPDGRGSGRQIEGSIHGPGSVQEITPRLRTLLGS